MIEIGEVTVPAATVARLPFYLRALRDLLSDGVTTTSSSGLAERSGVGSAQLRKDLSYLGSFGTRGVGYDVETLASSISAALGLGSEHRLAIVGVGNLGNALANYSGYAARGFRLVALIDADPDVVGRSAAGLEVEHSDRLEEILAARGVSMVILATPGAAAQAVAERIVACGVREILSFSPVALQLPDDVVVRSVDVAGELQILAFHAAARHAQSGDAVGVDGDPAVAGVQPSA
ncbi:MULTISPECIES: redox-sensing transcriptional repressor Rex [Isoptericola]|uniref:Redox-sensing transcriptional repressor Rex n=1 Tax=Isoptericola sediminis TaxID=2733572 RepID=A0A849JT86_9MICO|nr:MULTISPECIES: redox-sensing transcriptional repressor Rex [unclassified Isoptericola]MDO8147120.1 redox-sensing transcriptional repressor Rex [Isoptericola sp. b515]MDO8150565.1 redox-sensing transcriptional repressor Rex [Isoptericola sp. b408]NNU26502.1 redox-sensing transcriptional repressor Rex [Isoptericola sediminis]